MKRTALLSILMIGCMAAASTPTGAQSKPAVEVNLDVLDGAYDSTKVEVQELAPVTPVTKPLPPIAPTPPVARPQKSGIVPLKWVQTKPVTRPAIEPPKAPVVPVAVPVEKPALKSPLMTGPVIKPTPPAEPRVTPVRHVETPAPKPVDVSAPPTSVTSIPSEKTETPPAHQDLQASSKEPEPTPAMPPQQEPEAIATEAPVAAPIAPAVPAHGDLTLDFNAGSSDLGLDTQKKLDNVIRQMIDNENTRLQLRAYAKAVDETKSTARRLSLSRALAVRSYLMDQGVSPARVDVRALGAETDHTPLDRVDIVFIP